VSTGGGLGGVAGGLGVLGGLGEKGGELGGLMGLEVELHAWSTKARTRMAAMVEVWTFNMRTTILGGSEAIL
jgi:hypothetical protein